MTPTALIRFENSVWVVISRYGSGKGRVRFADGSGVSPAGEAQGVIRGNERVVELIKVTNDISTGANITADDSTEITMNGENPVAVVDTKIIRDKTAQEIDAEHDIVSGEHALSLHGKLDKLELAGLYWLVNDVRTRHGQQAITIDDFLTNLDTFASQFDDAKFIQKVKDVLAS